MKKTRRLMVSSCGTSILSNGADQATRSLLIQLANKSAAELDAQQKKRIDALAAERAQFLASSSLSDVWSGSAEISGIAAFYGRDFASGKGDQHIFVHSDTYQGALCASLLAEWCHSKNMAVETARIPGLNTADFASFSAAMTDLAQWCIERIAPERSPHCRVVFNLTGGYKSLQGFMQTLGMFYADEIVYLFEGAKELLRIPRLPINIDAGALDEIHANLRLFRQLSYNMKVSEQEISNISETMLFSLDGEHSLSAWGAIFWDRYRQERYGVELLPSPLPERIVYGPDFIKQAEQRFKGLPKYTFELNERIDQLARFLLSNQLLNPKGLTFKGIKGNPVPGSTHEFRAWSTYGGWRIFCHFEGAVCHIDTLREHL